MGTHQNRLVEAILMNTHNMFSWRTTENYPFKLIFTKYHPYMFYRHFTAKFN